MPYTPTWNNPYMPQNAVTLPYQQQYQRPMTYQQPYNGITKVNGRDSAMQVTLPPNSTSDPMFDNDGKHFYVISTDGTGTKTSETFVYRAEKQEATEIDHSKLVGREEFDELVRKVNELKEATYGTQRAVLGTSGEYEQRGGKAGRIPEN